MAAMQAQVEPHFLFNTLASIDHLIETDPPRASLMQRNLIALLRASMPSLREANAQGTRDLGQELAVIRPYLEILKVRMEDRLQTEINVPEGLHSAAFPPMMLQSLVENAIKHGLEPKAEGGLLSVRAEVLHGKLAVTVADTGLGFGKAPTAGTGTGLSNIRERLQLLYGHRAQVKITENQPSGTVVTLTEPAPPRRPAVGRSASRRCSASETRAGRSRVPPGPGLVTAGTPPHRGPHRRAVGPHGPGVLRACLRGSSTTGARCGCSVPGGHGRATSRHRGCVP